MDEVADVCAECRKPITNPRTLLCGHTFCLNPCLAPENSNQKYVQCPFCRIETPVSAVVSENSTNLSSSKSSSVCAECKKSCVSSKVCQHCSKAICPTCTQLHHGKSSANVVKKLTTLRSKKTQLASLKASLLKLRDSQVNCKDRLLREVTAATDQLRCQADCALEKAKLLVISTSVEEQTLVEKLGKDLPKLVQTKTTLSGRLSTIRLEKSPAVLKEFQLSTRSFRDAVKELQKSVKSCEDIDINNLKVTNRFETIHLQIGDLRLLTSDSADLLTPRQLESKSKRPMNRPIKKKTEWDVNPNRIFIGALPDSIKEHHLHEYFSKYGLVTDVFLLKGPNPHRCGFLTFRDLESVRKVLEAQPHKLNDTQITVSLAKNKRPQTGNGAANFDVSDCDKEKHRDRGTEDKNVDNDDAIFHTTDQPTIFVGQLKPTTSEADLKVYFSKFGTVKSARVVTNRTTGESRGFGFVTFAGRGAIEGGVLEACHFLDGCRLKVEPEVARSSIHDRSTQPNKKPDASTAQTTESRQRSASKRGRRERRKEGGTVEGSRTIPTSSVPSITTPTSRTPNPTMNYMPDLGIRTVSNATSSASNAPTPNVRTSTLTRNTGLTSSLSKPATASVKSSSPVVTTQNRASLQATYLQNHVPNHGTRTVSNAASSAYTPATSTARASTFASGNYQQDFGMFADRNASPWASYTTTSTERTPTASNFSHARRDEKKCGEKNDSKKDCQIL